MDFGKLSNVDTVDFTLPPDAPQTDALLKRLPMRVGLPRLYVGCTGWSVKEWIGRTYPKGTKPADYLREYAQQFNTIELNTTHYRTPSVSDIEKWYRDTPSDFRFAPKMLQMVSHSKNLGYGTGLTTKFCEAIAGLGEKMGVCFMQMPPHFSWREAEILEKYVSKFPKSLPLALEFRHPSVFSVQQEGHNENLFDILEKNNVSTVITDVSGRRDVLHQRLTTTKAVIRFVGNGLHPTDYSRVDAWLSRIGNWFEAGLHECYFFTHEPDNLLSPELADYVCQKAREKMAVILRGPAFYDVSLSRVIENGQTRLF
ncbi:MAG: DUF72 domain-containing protein [Saprospiraceae bacterium]|nr:DUF72 domain-containing protein [Saprospiraceae bacterium]